MKKGLPGLVQRLGDAEVLAVVESMNGTPWGALMVSLQINQILHAAIRRRPRRDDRWELRSLCPVHGERVGAENSISLQIGSFADGD